MLAGGDAVCTLILFTRAFADTPLLVAANRDEKLDRPAGPPAITTRGGMRILCPRDLEAGGTWLGLNAAGVFVGITNRFGGPPRPGVRSRGLLVLDALSHESARSAAEQVAALDPRSSNGFHLVIADRAEAHLVWSDTERVTLRVLPPGVQVVTERSFNAAPTEREAKIQKLLSDLSRDRAPDDAALEGLLSSHDDSGLEGICVHVPALGYGTRSSTIVRLEATGARMLQADGPPCETPYRSVPEAEALFC